MKSLAFAIIIASLHLRPRKSNPDLDEQTAAAIGYVICWAGFLLCLFITQ